ncbi:MAG: hypothetical protein KC466_15165, partial [Myxococcales bacterium]|nr:hypothetical protein [Myxococcales bacterium]
QAAATEYAPQVLAPGATGPGELYGLPLWVTELAPSYEGINGNPGVAEADYFDAPMDPSVGDLREMLLEANMYMLMVSSGVTKLTNLQLFDDILRGGLIEGVGIDSHHGDEMGLQRIGSARPPRLRPRGLLLEQMARHWRGQVVSTSVDSPTYAVGGDEVAMGKLGLTRLDAVPYVRAIGMRDETGNVLTLTLTNTHLSETIRANVSLGDFAPGGPIEATVLTGDDPGANNEPESDVCSNPGATPDEDCAPGVVPATSTLIAAGASLSVLLPPTSVTFVRVPLDGGDHTPPDAPFDFAATTDAAEGGVSLDWQWSGSEAVTFNVFRSVHWEASNRENEDDADVVEAPCLGPWGHRLHAEPLTTTSFVDTALDPGRVYCYGVEAVDAAGNRSEMVSVRHRGTIPWPLAPATVSLNDGAKILYGTALANITGDLAPPDGVPTNDDFLIIQPKLSNAFPPVGKEADLIISTEPFGGDPQALVALSMTTSLRFKTPLFACRAEIWIRDFAQGGIWESAQTIDLNSSFRKGTRHVLRLNPADYLSPEGRVEVRITTNSGDVFAELFLEHLRVELESL